MIALARMRMDDGSWHYVQIPVEGVRQIGEQSMADISEAVEQARAQYAAEQEGDDHA